MTGWVLAIDFGSSNTAAVLRRPDGRTVEVLFDGSPLLPSAVYAQPDGELLTGRDALRSARLAPERFEPHPKPRIDEGSVLLGADVPVTRLVAAVLRRAATEAARIAATTIGTVVLTHPAGWGPRRRSVLERAAADAGLTGLTGVTLLPEPVAAARYFRAHHAGPDPRVPVVVYDLGGGTLDVAVVAGERVLACDGLADAGGLDIDAALLDDLATQTAAQTAAEAWRPVRQPRTSAERRLRRQVQDDVREAKEMLSRTAQAFVHLPFLDRDVPVNRDQLERVAAPLVERTLAATRATLAAAGLTPPPPGPLYLVGGATRMPLIATALHRDLRAAPVVAEQPELVVAYGALLAVPATPTHPAPPPPPTPPPPTPPAPPAAESRPGMRFEESWTGDEDPRGFTTPTARGKRTDTFFNATGVLVFLFLLVVAWLEDSPTDGFLGFALGAVFTVLGWANNRGWRSRLRAALGPRTLGVDDTGATATDPFGTQHIPWSAVEEVSVRPAAPARIGNRLIELQVHALHVRLRPDAPEPRDRPTGWPFGAPPPGATDGWVPVCLLGPLPPQRRTELVNAVATCARRPLDTAAAW